MNIKGAIGVGEGIEAGVLKDSDADWNPLLLQFGRADATCDLVNILFQQWVLVQASAPVELLLLCFALFPDLTLIGCKLEGLMGGADGGNVRGSTPQQEKNKHQCGVPG